MVGASSVLLSTFSAPQGALASLRKSKEEILEELKQRNPKTPEEIEAEKEMKAEEKRKRLARQKELASQSVASADDAKKEVEIDANLRANYYFPTARKRYLPRVKAAADVMDDAVSLAESNSFERLGVLANGPLEDAVGPLKLYASALTGQGLSLSVSYVKDMTMESERYESALGTLKKAVKKRDGNKARAAVRDLEASLSKYRIAARINTPDGGVGAVPTDKRVGSGFGNNNPVLYERNNRARGATAEAAERDHRTSVLRPLYFVTILTLS
eukprot:CAMPEP_0185845616 /NCGR_PEP_ID=MMETSP1354-20130828/1528_1 /TAXON_ID=708628 /ORGANISM="Erythrolobus madagascarensis, Strain CCMP3276" /LENGTH=271 /DNA_ID=CAMNT_0028545611 /DNA_START=312 /DNA_END=1124 /DNA_ORIENTATION=+